MGKGYTRGAESGLSLMLTILQVGSKGNGPIGKAD